MDVGKRVSILELESNGYADRASSIAFPTLTGDNLTYLAKRGFTLGRKAWIRKVREWARSNAGTSG
jgi:hypothetical protein